MNSETPASAERFTGLAAVYARCRPDYPVAALDQILVQCGLTPDSLMVDVGCGTGISTRLFAQRSIRVIGIEPNQEMLDQARQEALPSECPLPDYRIGRADSTGLASTTADVVLAAQAFHWFDPEAALREFHRILKPGGWTVLMWNERDETDAFTQAYGQVIRQFPEAARIEAPRGKSGDALLVCPLFDRQERRLFHHSQVLDESGMLGRAFSASYAPREPEQAQAFKTVLQAAFSQHQTQGQVVLHYQTSVYTGRRPWSARL
jgi:ubiquinone/menaquinone biosynthesis C-methylase UbiE